MKNVKEISIITMNSFLPKIISFSGRKQSGKTELANVCKKYDYEIINFADSMKNLICELLKITRVEMEETKDNEKEIKLTDDNLILLSEKTDIDINIFKNEKTEFHSIREILQFLGTDIIRKHNSQWHINKMKNIIEENPDKKYCIGDTRFINEKEFVESLGGECWFIIRPNNLHISNHISEIELTWFDFNRNILINKNLNDFINKWNKYLELHLNDNINITNAIINETNYKMLRNKLIYLLNNYNIKDILKDTKMKNTKLKWLCNKLTIFQFNERNRYLFKDTTIYNAYLFGQLETNGYIKLKTKNSPFIYFEHRNKMIVNNFKKSLNSRKKIEKNKSTRKFYIKCDDYLIIENLKRWDSKFVELIL